MAVSPFVFFVELGLGTTLTGNPNTWSWTDVTDWVGKPDITIRRGRADKFSEATPDTCALTFLNNAGRFVPRNPLSPYYGQLKANTPLRVMIRPQNNTASDAFGRTVSGGLGTADVGGAWTVIGTAGDYAVSTTNGARMTQGTANVQHVAVLPASVLRVDLKTRIRVNAASTGASQTAGVAFRYSGTGDFLRAVVDFAPGGAMTVRIVHRVGGVETPGTAVATGLTHSTSTWYWLRLQTGYNAVRAKVWADGTTEPATWQLDGSTTALTILTAGQFGLYARRETGNTNASATTDFEDFSMFDAPRVQFTGFVDKWPVTWADSALTQSYAPITASGQLRRLGRTQPVRSAIYRACVRDVVDGTSTGVAYWPMEDGSQAKVFAAAIGGSNQGYTGTISPGSDSAFIGSDPLPVFGGNGSIRFTVPTYPSNPTWAVRWAMRIPASSISGAAQIMSWTVPGGNPIVRWQLTLNAGSPDQVSLSGWNAAGAVVFSGTPTDFTDPSDGSELSNGRQLYFEVEGTQNGGNIDTTWIVWFPPNDSVNFGPSSNTGFTQSTAATNANVGLIYHDAATGFANGGHTIGHVALGTDVLFGAGNVGVDGDAGVQTDIRFHRLCDELGIVGLVGDLVRGVGTTTQLMGPQKVGDVLSQLREIETTELGVIHDSKLGYLEFLPRSMRANRPVDMTLDVNQGHARPPFEPVDDDWALRNDITVTNIGGSFARATDPTSIAYQGVHAETVQVNVYRDIGLQDQADWRLNLGIFGGLRYPAIAVNLTSKHLALASSWLDTDVGSRIQVTNVPHNELPPETLDLIVDGYTERISSTEWGVEFNVSPAAQYSALALDSSTLALLDGASSTLTAAATSGATTLPVSTPGDVRWSTTGVPYDVGISGEQITVNSAGPAVTDTFTRSVSNAWGTATSGQAWTATATATDYSATGTLGRIATTTINQLYYAVLDTQSTDQRVQVTASCPVVPTGAPITLRVTARYTDTSNFYNASLSIATTGVATLSLTKNVAGSGSVVNAGVTVGSHSAGNSWTIVLDVTGSTLSARAWNASTGSDPGGWQVTSTDTSLTTGTLAGCGVRRETSNTNGAQNIDFDNFSVPNPQALGVTRAVNGIVKALPAGSAVQLWSTGVLGL